MGQCEKTDESSLARRHDAILEAAGEGIYGLDAAGRVTFANRAAARLTGWTRDEQIGEPQHRLIHHSYVDGSPYPVDDCPICATLMEGVTHSGETHFWHRDGNCFPVYFTSSPLRDEQDATAGAVVTFSDQTVRHMARRYRAVAEAVSDITWLCDANGAIRDIDGQWSEFTGLSRTEVLGWGWTRALHPADRDAYLARRARGIAAQRPFDCEVRFVTVDGRVVWFSNRVVPVADDEGRLVEWVGVGREITARKTHEEKLEQHARYDQLTRTLNRWSFEEQLSRSVSRVQEQPGETFSLVLFDVDHFKSINDHYGHDVGDAVLRSLATYTNGFIREDDALARWGGEEFMILLPRASLQRAGVLAHRLNRHLREAAFPGPGRVTISAGVAEFRPRDTTLGLIRRLDAALYRAKKNGRDQVVLDSAGREPGA